MPSGTAAVDDDDDDGGGKYALGRYISFTDLNIHFHTFATLLFSINLSDVLMQLIPASMPVASTWWVPSDGWPHMGLEKRVKERAGNGLTDCNRF